MDHQRGRKLFRHNITLPPTAMMWRYTKSTTGEIFHSAAQKLSVMHSRGPLMPQGALAQPLYKPSALFPSWKGTSPLMASFRAATWS